MRWSPLPRHDPHLDASTLSARPLPVGTRDAAMPSGPGERYDFFLSRRGSVAAIAQEVTDVRKEGGYGAVGGDYDFQVGESWVWAIHNCIKSSRDLIILFTSDY